MRHQKKKKTLDRARDSRRALFRGLMVNFILNKKMATTQAKAKAVRPRIERLITQAKKDNLATRRYLLSKLNNQAAVNKLIKDIAPKYADRAGGYTRLVKLGFRIGDGADLVQLELI